jgi:hypothetical protein
MKLNMTINSSLPEDLYLLKSEMVNIRGKKYVMAIDSSYHINYFWTRVHQEFRLFFRSEFD